MLCLNRSQKRATRSRTTRRRRGDEKGGKGSLEATVHLTMPYKSALITAYGELSETRQRGSYPKI